MLKILIVGANSFLASAIIPLLLTAKYEVQGLMRELKNGEKYPEYVTDPLTFFTHDISKVDLDNIHAVLYFRPDCDAGIFQAIRQSNTPVCAIGSGAMIDFRHLQKQDPAVQPNDYVQGKLDLVANADLTIHPGFYIPDASHKDIGRGLHRDTLASLFRDDAAPIPEDKMDKAYYMTSVRLLADLLLKWVADPTAVRGEFAFGTPMPISRRELRDKTSPSAKPIYLEDMKVTQRVFGPAFFHTPEVISRLHYDAKAWITQN